MFCKNRKRISKCFNRKFDAQKWFEDQEMLHQFAFKKKLKFSKAAEVWLENHSKVRKSSSSYRADKSIIKTFESYFGDLDLEEVIPKQVERYISKIFSTGIKHPTIKRQLQCLRAILNYFMKKRYFTFNAVSIVDLLPEAKASNDYLNFEEADRFLTYTNKKYESQNPGFIL